MLIDILLLASSEIILGLDGQSVKITFRDHSSETVQTLESYTREAPPQSGFALTGKPDVILADPDRAIVGVGGDAPSCRGCLRPPLKLHCGNQMFVASH
jgi:hypothetical protein